MLSSRGPDLLWVLRGICSLGVFHVRRKSCSHIPSSPKIPMSLSEPIPTSMCRWRSKSLTAKARLSQPRLWYLCKPFLVFIALLKCTSPHASSGSVRCIGRRERNMQPNGERLVEKHALQGSKSSATHSRNKHVVASVIGVSGCLLTARTGSLHSRTSYIGAHK